MGARDVTMTNHARPTSRGRSHRNDASEDDRWSRMLSMLCTLSTHPQIDALAAHRRAQSSAASRTHVPTQDTEPAACDQEVSRTPPCRPSVTLVDRVSEKIVVLRWISTSCHYGDQVWVECIARRAGVCALTGLPIRRGDTFYSPRCRGRCTPVNAAAMLHSTALDGIALVSRPA